MSASVCPSVSVRPSNHLSVPVRPCPSFLPIICPCPSVRSSVRSVILQQQKQINFKPGILCMKIVEMCIHFHSTIFRLLPACNIVRMLSVNKYFFGRLPGKFIYLRPWARIPGKFTSFRICNLPARLFSARLGIKIAGSNFRLQKCARFKISRMLPARKILRISSVDKSLFFVRPPGEFFFICPYARMPGKIIKFRICNLSARKKLDFSPARPGSKVAYPG